MVLSKDKECYSQRYMISRVLYRKLENQKLSACNFTWLDLFRLINEKDTPKTQEVVKWNNFPLILQYESLGSHQPLT
jgi:hypothetical protein